MITTLSSATGSNAACCRFCGCTPQHPCRVPGGDECAYVFLSKPTRCNAPACEAAFERERRLCIEKDRVYRQQLAELRKRDKKHRRNRQRRAA